MLLVCQLSIKFYKILLFTYSWSGSCCKETNCRMSSHISWFLVDLWRIWCCAQSSQSGSGSSQVLQNLEASVCCLMDKHGTQNNKCSAYFSVFLQNMRPHINIKKVVIQSIIKLRNHINLWNWIYVNIPLSVYMKKRVFRMTLCESVNVYFNYYMLYDYMSTSLGNFRRIFYPALVRIWSGKFPFINST